MQPLYIALKRRSFSSFFIIFLGFILSACGGGNDDNPAPTATLTNIIVNSSQPSMAAGLTQQLNATGIHSDGTSQTISNPTWSSSNTSIATVDSTGTVKSLTPGSVKISATFNGFTGSTNLTITSAVLQSIHIATTTTSIAAGLTQQFVATGIYSDGTSQAITNPVWSSSNSNIATVNSTGLVKSLTAGSVNITASFNGLTTSSPLTVTNAILKSIVVTPTASSVAAGLTQQFTATGIYSDGTSQTIANPTWSSSSPSVATVSATGLVKSLRTSSVSIIATFGGITGSSTLVVTAATLKSISLTPTTPSLAAGLTLQLTATGTYSDGTSQIISNPVWSSSNTSLATVGSTGLVRSLTPGGLTISASLNGISGSTLLTVTAATLTSITVQPTTSSGTAGSQQFTATGIYTDGSSQVIANATWSSSNTTNLTVSSTGLAQSIASGQTTISATFNGLTGNTTVITPSFISYWITGPTVTQMGFYYTYRLMSSNDDDNAQTGPNISRNVDWSASDSSVDIALALHQNEPIITFNSAGQKTITAKYTNVFGVDIVRSVIINVQ